MALLVICGRQLDVSEAELVGILCFMHDTFKTHPIFDIEVSIHSKTTIIPTIFPRSFTLQGYLNHITQFCNTLQVPNDLSCLAVHPIFSDTSNVSNAPTFYYIKDCNIKSFMEGYVLMCRMTKQIIESEGGDVETSESQFNPNYDDAWTADQEYLSKAKLAAKPGDNILDKNFTMSIPSYMWRISPKWILYTKNN